MLSDHKEILFRILFKENTHTVKSPNIQVFFPLRYHTANEANVMKQEKQMKDIDLKRER